LERNCFMSLPAMFAVPMHAWQRSEFGERDEIIDAHPPPARREDAESPLKNDLRLISDFISSPLPYLISLTFRYLKWTAASVLWIPCSPMRP